MLRLSRPSSSLDTALTVTSICNIKAHEHPYLKSTAQEITETLKNTSSLCQSVLRTAGESEARENNVSFFGTKTAETFIQKTKKNKTGTVNHISVVKRCRLNNIIK